MDKVKEELIIINHLLTAYCKYCTKKAHEALIERQPIKILAFFCTEHANEHRTIKESKRP